MGKVSLFAKGTKRLDMFFVDIKY